MATYTLTGRIGATLATTLAKPAATGTTEQSLLAPPHTSPTKYDPSNPIVVFIIQASIIISLSAFLGIFLKRIRQPRVISEVIGGIILGPTAMGRVKGFTNNIFPAASIPNLNLIANVGLVLFLFIVGLETDLPLMRRNWRAACSVGLVGLALPFGFGAAVAKGLYDKFIDTAQVSFGHFLLFVAVAFAITAFPVLCRILTELRLLSNHVGLATLAAGVFNDVVGWILLALAVTLVNAGSGTTAVYVLLCVVGWTVLLAVAIAPAFRWIAKREGSLDAEHGPSQQIICLAILLTFASAFFTQVIGVHAIFGGFLVGLFMPHEGKFRAHMTEKIEDLVTVFFLPLYFALSGLKTDLGLLNNGSIWGWAICVIVVAELGKFLPCAAAAKLTGMTWRESGAIGSLMACKGLVELIVLNIGLSAGILNPPVFAMFVLMALVTTFMTTPLTIAFYPESYRLRRAAEVAAIKSETADAAVPVEKRDGGADEDAWWRSKYLVVLNRLEHLPSMMAFVKLLQPPLQYSPSVSSTGSLNKEDEAAESSAVTSALPSSGITIDALRLIELSSRFSDVMKASETEETARQDPLSNIFRTFANLNGVNISSSVAVVPEHEFSSEIVSVANVKASDMVIVPWSAHRSVQPSGASSSGIAESSKSPFEKIFGTFGSHAPADPSSHEDSPQTAALVRSIFAESTCDVALFLERGSSGIPVPTAGSRPWTGREHVFFAFFGGPDDRTALDFVVQLCRHPGVTATVVRISRAAEATDEDSREPAASKVSTESGVGGSHDPHALLSQLTIHGAGGAGRWDTVYGTTTSAHNLQSETADNLVWEKYFSTSEDIVGRRHPAVQAALQRVRAEVVSTAFPLQTTLRRAARAASETDAPLLVVASRGRRGAESHAAELVGFLKDKVASGHGLGVASSSEVRKTLGDVGSAVVVSGVAGAVLVIQAGSHKAQRRKDV